MCLNTERFYILFIRVDVDVVLHRDLHTVCPRSSDPFHTVTYCLARVANLR